MHDDGDEEDVETHELEKAARYYEEGIQEQPESEREEVSLSVQPLFGRRFLCRQETDV